MSCEECRQTWDNKPPCDECEKPAGLYVANELAWHTWQICNKMGRDAWSGNMRMADVMAVLAGLDGGADDLDRVVAIEDVAMRYREKKQEDSEE